MCPACNRCIGAGVPHVMRAAALGRGNGKMTGGQSDVAAVRPRAERERIDENRPRPSIRRFLWPAPPSFRPRPLGPVCPPTVF